jgi:hypothetical protein
VVSSIWALICATRPSISAFWPAPSTIVVFSLEIETFFARLDAEVFGDHRAARQDGDVFEHGLAAVAEARSLDGSDLEAATQLVDDERSEGFAFDVFSDDDQRLAGLDDGFENREHGLEVRELLLVQENVGVFEVRDHLFRVGHEVGRQVAAVELHAFDDFEFGFGGLGFFNRDDAFVADLLHGFGNVEADLALAVGRDRADLRDFFRRVDLLGLGLEILDDFCDGEVDAALQVHRVHAGGNGLGAFANDGLGENRGGRRAVAGDVVGLGGDFTDELGAHVLELVFQFDFLGDGNAVLGDARSAEGLVDDDVAALRAERDLHGVCEDVDATQHLFARAAAELYFFGCHCENS